MIFKFYSDDKYVRMRHQNVIPILETSTKKTLVSEHLFKYYFDRIHTEANDARRIMRPCLDFQKDEKSSFFSKY